MAKESNTNREKRYLSYFSSHSGKLSMVVRLIYCVMLALFLFKGQEIPRLVSLVVVSDICQYLYASMVWSFVCFKINNNSKAEAVWFINFGTNFFFYTKAIILILYLLS